MAEVPLHLPESLIKAIDRATDRGLDRAVVFRRMLVAGLDRYMAEIYVARRISLREAAEWLGVPVRVAWSGLPVRARPGT
jgi:hypothetical protein